MRATVLLLLPLALSGGSPSPNTWYLIGHDRRVAALNRSLTPVEQDWFQGVLRSAKLRAPTQIGDWHLSDASAEFNPGKAHSWGREYFGARLRFEYRDAGGREAIVYHFINPVRIHYPEVGWGYYLGFFSYHNKRDTLLDTPALRIFLNGGRLPLESSMVPEADKDLVNNRSTVKVCCYRGKGWTRSEQQDPNETGNIFVDMGLNFREKQWKTEVYGDLSIAVIPRNQDAKGFVLHYLGAE
jgi:hypothetical protein